jgi:hypothetical protein
VERFILISSSEVYGTESDLMTGTTRSIAVARHTKAGGDRLGLLPKDLRARRDGDPAQQLRPLPASRRDPAFIIQALTDKPRH